MSTTSTSTSTITTGTIYRTRFFASDGIDKQLLSLSPDVSIKDFILHMRAIDEDTYYSVRMEKSLLQLEIKFGITTLINLVNQLSFTELVRCNGCGPKTAQLIKDCLVRFITDYEANKKLTAITIIEKTQVMKSDIVSERTI